MPRDDFNAATKKLLEERAGHHCSFPGCSAVTTGPSDESSTAISKTGMACHIAAASGGPGARRYVESMSPEERSSPENGIWMCYKHGKIIDTDERRYSISMLQKWREMAYYRAQWRHEHGDDKPVPLHVLQGRFGFADEQIDFVGLGEENARIGQALIDCCVPLFWGDDLSGSLRDFFIEVTRNAFVHGKASGASIRITKHAVFACDNGSDFNCLDLNVPNFGRGGALAVRHLLSEFGSKLVFGAKRGDGQNEIMIALGDSLTWTKYAQPCCVFLDRKDMETIKHGELPAFLSASELNPCRILYIVLPPFFAPSDVVKVGDSISPAMFTGKQIVFVPTGGISKLVCGQLIEKFPSCKILGM